MNGYYSTIPGSCWDELSPAHSRTKATDRSRISFQDNGKEVSLMKELPVKIRQLGWSSHTRQPQI